MSNTIINIIIITIIIVTIITILEEHAVFGLGIVKSITVRAKIFWSYLSTFYLVPLASGQLVLVLVRLYQRQLGWGP